MEILWTTVISQLQLVLEEWMVRATRLLASRKVGTRRKTFFATLPCQLLMGMFKDLSLNMHNLRTIFSLKVPVVTVVTGEGGSGGALAIA